jgi:hypothetical protein
MYCTAPTQVMGGEVPLMAFAPAEIDPGHPLVSAGMHAARRTITVARRAIILVIF